MTRGIAELRRVRYADQDFTKPEREEALASRALLREVNCGPLRGVTQDVADRIRDHLAGKP